MGLTNSSIGLKAVDSGLMIKKRTAQDKIICLAGNPNVGKSTVFNGLTGLNQHTGNWPGKTVANAQGYCTTETQSYVMVDIPGTYSLMAHSTEEEIARNFICFGQPDGVVVVCDATNLERNLNLVLQTIEICPNVVVCVNLMDEAQRKHIHVDLTLLQQQLGVPVVGTTARKRKSLSTLLHTLDQLCTTPQSTTPYTVQYPAEIEEAIAMLEPVIRAKTEARLNSRWLSLRLLDQDASLLNEIDAYLGSQFLADPELITALEKATAHLAQQQIQQEQLQDKIISALVSTAEAICKKAVQYPQASDNSFDRRLDHILTSKHIGYAVMLALLALIFWITIVGANYPSQFLSYWLFLVQDKLTAIFQYFHAPEWLHGMLVLGIYRTLAWVIAVMLPPMAIFFPLFTLLEDAGYLPRVAYNLDKPFKRCCACGKQALTMCMGFGCNAAGVIGCRIIDSPRERLLAILTNSFVPCNGRFPTLIALITMFFIGTGGGFLSSLLSALLLTMVIVLGILMTFAATRLLSSTLLKGIPSSFTLELPPYRKPQVGKVIVRSIFDRTLFVLGRAIAVAAPAGLIIWLLANVKVSGASILHHCTLWLDPFARLLGLDGAILIAFILGFPANEIVMPILMMTYMAQGTMLDLASLTSMKQLLVANGWTWLTASCMILFSLMHWPCATTLLTIKKETGSWKWTALAVAIPTLFGMGACILLAGIVRLFN